MDRGTIAAGSEILILTPRTRRSRKEQLGPKLSRPTRIEPGGPPRRRLTRLHHRGMGTRRSSEASQVARDEAGRQAATCYRDHGELPRESARCGRTLTRPMTCPPVDVEETVPQMDADEHRSEERPDRAIRERSLSCFSSFVLPICVNPCSSVASIVFSLQGLCSCPRQRPFHGTVSRSNRGSTRQLDGDLQPRFCPLRGDPALVQLHGTPGDGQAQADAAAGPAAVALDPEERLEDRRAATRRGRRGRGRAPSRSPRSPRTSSPTSIGVPSGAWRIALRTTFSTARRRSSDSPGTGQACSRPEVEPAALRLGLQAQSSTSSGAGRSSADRPRRSGPRGRPRRG